LVNNRHSHKSEHILVLSAQTGIMRNYNFNPFWYNFGINVKGYRLTFLLVFLQDLIRFMTLIPTKRKRSASCAGDNYLL